MAARKPKPEAAPQPAGPPRIDLTIKVENYGPIRSGKVTLHPLTVLIGPNNSGKSYMARLVDALSAALADLTSYPDPPHGVRGSTPPDGTSEQQPARLGQLKLALRETIEALPDDYVGPLDDGLIAAHCVAGMNTLYSEVLPQHLEASTGMRLSELVSGGVDAAVVGISGEAHSAEVRLGAGGAEVDLGSVRPADVALNRHERSGFGVGHGPQGRMSLYLGQDWYGLADWHLASVDRGWLLGAMPRALRVACRYLPAGRCGLMQGYRPIVSSVIAGTQWTGVRPSRAPRLLGAVARFLSVLFDPPEVGGAVSAAVARAEHSLTGGTIVVRRTAPLLAPDFRFRFDGTEIPLESASSSVGELAPLFVYLREVARPGDLLIIEEPEAHLHPENQRLIARLFAKLVSEGLNIIITTHSDFLLEELHNLVLAHGLDERDRKRALGEYHDCTLPPEDVGVFLFSKPTNKKGEFVGSRVRQLKVTAEEGIPSDEFTRVFEEMYNDSVRIRRWLPGGEEE